MTKAESIFVKKFFEASQATRDALVGFVAEVGMAIQAADTDSKAAGRVDTVDGVKKILDAYNSLPEGKRLILIAVMDGFLAGMDAQKRLTEKQAG